MDVHKDSAVLSRIEVVETGRGVTNVRAGQRVSIMPLLFCGTCYFCRRGLNHLCVSMACIGLSYDWGGIVYHQEMRRMGRGKGQENARLTSPLLRSRRKAMLLT